MWVEEERVRKAFRQHCILGIHVLGAEKNMRVMFDPHSSMELSSVARVVGMDMVARRASGRGPEAGATVVALAETSGCVIGRG